MWSTVTAVSEWVHCYQRMLTRVCWCEVCWLHCQPKSSCSSVSAEGVCHFPTPEDLLMDTREPPVFKCDGICFELWPGCGKSESKWRLLLSSCFESGNSRSRGHHTHSLSLLSTSPTCIFPPLSTVVKTLVTFKLFDTFVRQKHEYIFWQDFQSLVEKSQIDYRTCILLT